MQGPSAAANIPQPDTLSSPPLALREALRRAGSAPNVRREIQRVQSLIGLRWCVFFMRSPGGCCLRTASSRHGTGLAARSKRAQFVPWVPCSCGTPFFHCGKDWHPAGSHKPGSRGSIPRPANQFQLRGGHQLVQPGLQNPACPGQHRDSVPFFLRWRP